ncbi:butyrophilin subfamily 3 member A2-like isoform X2 [Dromaius novaehollandiae]|uniref:butyrophilin subfamily 3 member A2-like isoform X2 n=1 Tax=Dromaius novaehollandiae TaxID=8790 RepID=UPI0031203D5D
MEKSKWFVIIVALLTDNAVSANFDVTSPQSITGLVGQDIVFPCQISSTKPLDSIEVQWKKITAGQIENVHLYKQQSGDTPGPNYRGRTALPKDGFAAGKVPLILKRVKPEDEGTYSCIVKSRDWSADATTLLSIAANGKISLEILGPEGQGVKLACRSHGWFPKPVVQWVTRNEQNLSSDTAIHKDSEQLFNVLSQITVTGEKMGEVTCQILNTLVQTKEETSIRLSSAAFPRTSPWLSAFWILFTLFLLLVAASAFMVFKARQRTSKEKAEEEKEKLKTQAFQELQDQCEFRNARSYMVPITLDTVWKHPELTVSSDQRTVQHKSSAQEPAVEHQLPIVLAKEGFDSGRWYWEVRLCDGLDWEVGVLTEAMRMNLKGGSWQDLPKHGVWSLKRVKGDFWPEEANAVIQARTEKPAMVGVDLDLSQSTLSFYDVAVAAPILKIPIEGSTRLYPFLRPGLGEAGENGKPLSINNNTDWDCPQTFKKTMR